MFRTRRRADFIDWTDYRWEPGAWRGAAASRARGRHTVPGRQYSFLQVFLAGLAVVAGVRLLSALTRSRGTRSWVERGVLAVLLLIVASYVSRQRRPL